MGHLARDSTAGVVKNIGDCIPRYTILSALDFLYKTDVLMALVYVLVFLGKVIFIFYYFRKCKHGVKGNVCTGE